MPPHKNGQALPDLQTIPIHIMFKRTRFVLDSSAEASE